MGMKPSIDPQPDTRALRLMIEMFEHELARLFDRHLETEARSAIAALRESWAKLAEVAFGPIERVRLCPSCHRSHPQTGPRCVFCWNKLAMLDEIT